MIGAGPNPNDSRPKLIVILNWFEELSERVPTGR